MALADFAAYIEKMQNPFQRIAEQKIVDTYNANPIMFRDNTYYGPNGPSGSTFPTTAAVTTRADKESMFNYWDGSNVIDLGFKNGAGNQWLGRSRIRADLPTGSSLEDQAGTLVLFDRLSHQGDLPATTGTSTTNLPTAALTRYTSGEGVWIMAGRMTGTLGGTVVDITCSYTNQAGTAGRTSGIIKNIAGEEQGLFQVFPLQQGDTGARSVESVTLSAQANAGTHAWGISLIKPLLIMPYVQYANYEYEALEACRFVEIVSGACLNTMFIAGHILSGYNTSLNAEFEFFEA